MGFFSDLFGTSGAATDAANAKIAGLQQAQKYADPLYAQGRSDITSGFGQAQNIFQPGYNLGQGGASAYADITGAAGQPGQDRARALFQTDPGYEFARNEALRATERTQGTGGFQGSGNVLTALEDRASGLAQQQYGNYVNRLAPFLPYAQGTAGQLGGAYAGQGTALNANDLSQAQLGYGTQAGIGSAQAGGILGEAQANQAALGQLLNFGGQLLGYGTGGSGLRGVGAGGSTSIFGGAGPLFGGTNPNAWYTG